MAGSARYHNSPGSQRRPNSACRLNRLKFLSAHPVLAPDREAQSAVEVGDSGPVDVAVPHPSLLQQPASHGTHGQSQTPAALHGGDPHGSDPAQVGAQQTLPHQVRWPEPTLRCKRRQRSNDLSRAPDPDDAGRIARGEHGAHDGLPTGEVLLLESEELGRFFLCERADLGVCLFNVFKTATGHFEVGEVAHQVKGAPPQFVPVFLQEGAHRIQVEGNAGPEAVQGFGGDSERSSPGFPGPPFARLQQDRTYTLALMGRIDEQDGQAAADLVPPATGTADADLGEPDDPAVAADHEGVAALVAGVANGVLPEYPSGDRILFSQALLPQVQHFGRVPVWCVTFRKPAHFLFSPSVPVARLVAQIDLYAILRSRVTNPI